MHVLLMLQQMTRVDLVQEQSRMKFSPATGASIAALQNWKHLQKGMLVSCINRKLIGNFPTTEQYVGLRRYQLPWVEIEEMFQWTLTRKFLYLSSACPPADCSSLICEQAKIHEFRVLKTVGQSCLLLWRLPSVRTVAMFLTFMETEKVTTRKILQE